MTYSADVLKLNPELAPATVYRVKAERTLKRSDGFDSDLERDYDLELTARGVPHIHHPFSFNLPGGVGYEPDFIAWYGTQVVYYEVKGDDKMRNARDSRTRFRIASGLHPYARFIWVTRNKRGQWIEKVVTAATRGG